MLDIAATDAGIATVLSHEISHNVCHHIGERISRSSLYSSIVLFLTAGVDWSLTTSFLTFSFIVNLLLKYPMSREQENEADQVGLVLMAASCYDPRAALTFWGRMSALTKKSGEEIPEFWSTHPSNESRIRALERM
jgi:Zn-dependent protease with chaperone function